MPKRSAPSGLCVAVHLEVHVAAEAPIPPPSPPRRLRAGPECRGGSERWINFIGKGRTWDLYPPAQAFWVACSVVAVIVVGRRPSGRRLVGGVIALVFLDSFVDQCAVGNACWWARPPVLVAWQSSVLPLTQLTLRSALRTSSISICLRRWSRTSLYCHSSRLR